MDTTELREKAQQKIKHIKGELSDAKDSMAETLEDAADSAKEKLKDAGDTIKEKFQDAKEYAEEMTKKIKK